MPEFRKVEIDNPSKLVFGVARHSLNYGFGLKIGQGEVVPEVKFFPRTISEKDEAAFRKEVESITKDILDRAVELGVSSLQIETEQSFMETKKPGLVAEVTNIQKSMMEKYAREYGIKLGLRVTIADIRDFREGLRSTSEYNLMLEAFEKAASNGADILSIESEGGKDVFNYSILRQDVKGIFFSVGLLGPLDMSFIWRDIVSIARRNSSIPGGDTACATANTAMRIAGGIKSMNIPHTLAAIVRAISASRSLVAYEEGAVGPGKDCGYENVIIKAITGYPMSMEGKSSACAHSSLIGNIASACCDLWSNEQVENIRLFGGSGPQVFLEILYYDCKLMNRFITLGKQNLLRDMLVLSDKFEDPQAFVLSPEVAIEIGKAIVSEKGYYRRGISACLKTIELMENEKNLRLNPPEQRFLSNLKKLIEALPDDEDEFRDQMCKAFSGKVQTFREKDYWP
ncbi:MAG: methyltransferase MtaB domain-containing protein [Nitrososphaerota archaeon]|nr:methyltransferase MtaB domain-containing protein [Nitrososphaerota archaeon]